MKATLFECIGQSFAIVGMPIAKASLGAFILRLVTVPLHRALVWGMMILVALASLGMPPFLVFFVCADMVNTLNVLAQILCFWLSCVPFRYVYDRRIPGGYCPIDTRPTSYILCGQS